MKVVIVASGGVVSNVFSDDPFAEIHILDYDEADGDERALHDMHRRIVAMTNGLTEIVPQ